MYLASLVSSIPLRDTTYFLCVCLDLPSYKWDPSFSLDAFAAAIESANGGYWFTTRAALCSKLQIPFTSGFSDYSTRRLRRQICGPDLSSVTSKQLTLPVMIPYELEDFILNTLPTLYDLPEHFASFPCLIPLYDANNPHQFIPPLTDTASEVNHLPFQSIRSLLIPVLKVSDAVTNFRPRHRPVTFVSGSLPMNPCGRANTAPLTRPSRSCGRSSTG